MYGQDKAMSLLGLEKFFSWDKDDGEWVPFVSRMEHVDDLLLFILEYKQLAIDNWLLEYLLNTAKREV